MRHSRDFEIIILGAIQTVTKKRERGRKRGGRNKNNIRPKNGRKSNF